MATKKFKGLGRGLEALLGPKLDESTSLDAASAELPNQLALSDLVPGSYQPRTRMDEGALYELAESIKAQGIMQPILVRPLEEAEGLRRLAAFPDVPTLKELGHDVEFNIWCGIFAPAGTPAPVIESLGRAFPVEIRHRARDLRDPRDLPEAMASAIREALITHPGDVLAFLPGWGEIRRTAERLGGLDALVLPLHGELPPLSSYPEEQRGRIETDLKNLKLRQPDGTAPGASRA